MRRPPATEEGERGWWLGGRWQQWRGYRSNPTWAPEEMELVLPEMGKAAGRTGLGRMIQSLLLDMRHARCLTSSKSSIHGSYHYHDHHPQLHLLRQGRGILMTDLEHEEEVPWTILKVLHVNSLQLCTIIFKHIRNLCILLRREGPQPFWDSPGSCKPPKKV